KFQELSRLTIENGKIAEIQLSGGKAKKPKPSLKGKAKVEGEEKENIISCEGKYVLPGFIDPHTHLTLMEEGIGWNDADMNEPFGQITPHIRAMDALKLRDQAFKDALWGGVTCCMVTPGSSNPICGQACVIKLRGNTVEDAIVRENAGVKLAFGENPKQNYGEQKQFPSSRMGIAAVIREWLMKAQDYAKRKKTKDFKERDIKLEALLPLLEGKVQARAHAHMADDIITAYRIAQEFNLDLVVEHCTEGHLISKELGRWKARVVIGPTFSNRCKPELRHKTFDTARILMDEGCLVALTTDHPIIPIEGLSLAAALTVRHGLDEERALKAISENPAMILGLDKRLGKLETGFDADVVVWNGHPLDTRSKVETVFIDGNQMA
ncbi:amidohydrolase, partial [bacterium]|nr:amidohydrolase [bacterium]